MYRRIGLVLAILAVAPRPAQAVLPSLTRYFSIQELAAGHPLAEDGLVYHGVRHTRDVRKIAYDLARSRQRSHADAVFVSEVALLHDWDPGRKAGTPARVPATIAALQADFDGTAPLVPGHAGSVLRDRFGWDAGKLAMAIAMIQRTEFPFAESHPSPAYAGSSPRARYASLLSGLDRAQRRFVLEEGPLLSEYADKVSYPLSRRFSAVARAQKGLAGEINRSAGKQVASPITLDAPKFLSMIGKREGFAFDHELAERFGETISLPTLGRALSLLPKGYRVRFDANVAGMKVFHAVVKGGGSLTRAVRLGQKQSRLGR